MFLKGVRSFWFGLEEYIAAGPISIRILIDNEEPEILPRRQS